MRNPTITSYY